MKFLEQLIRVRGRLVQGRLRISLAKDEAVAFGAWLFLLAITLKKAVEDNFHGFGCFLGRATNKIQPR